MSDQSSTTSSAASPLQAARGNATPRRLASIKEACEYGKFGHSKLYNLINEARVKAYKFGPRTLVDLDSIDAMFNELPPVVPNPNAK